MTTVETCTLLESDSSKLWEAALLSSHQQACPETPRKKQLLRGCERVHIAIYHDASNRFRTHTVHPDPLFDYHSTRYFVIMLDVGA